jgi:IBR domain, a half RING-finger domain
MSVPHISRLSCSLKTDSNTAICPKICCTRCGFEICYNHQIAWHKGLTCNEYSDGKVRDAPSQEYFFKFCKRCPSENCGIPIEKNGACPDMTCGKCGRRFCWECKVMTHLGRYEHIAGCPVRPSATRTQPHPESGPYRDDWAKDVGYIGHPGEYDSGYERYTRVTVDERPS